MKATVLSFRRGRHNLKTNQLLLSVKDIESESSALKLLGKKVTVKTSGGRSIIGKVSGSHGKKGVLRARFRQGVPAGILGKEIEVAD
jgi:large subunit ribosomal protein L35Ae